MYPYWGIVRTYRWPYGLATRLYNPNNLTHQYSGVLTTPPRDPRFSDPLQTACWTIYFASWFFFQFLSAEGSWLCSLKCLFKNTLYQIHLAIYTFLRSLHDHESDSLFLICLLDDLHTFACAFQHVYTSYCKFFTMWILLSFAFYYQNG